MKKIEDNIIYESDNFIVCVPNMPHIPREDGGHLYIRSKKNNISSRLDLTSKEATEVMRLTMLISKAMIEGMKKRNIKIERVNYQENGNWAFLEGNKPFFHIHIYGRVKKAKTQTWGEALVFPDKDTNFYDNFKPFNDKDIEEIKKEINYYQNNRKYNIENWNIEKTNY